MKFRHALFPTGRIETTFGNVQRRRQRVLQINTPRGLSLCLYPGSPAQLKRLVFQRLEAHFGARVVVLIYTQLLTSTSYKMTYQPVAILAAMPSDNAPRPRYSAMPGNKCSLWGRTGGCPRRRSSVMRLTVPNCVLSHESI